MSKQANGATPSPAKAPRKKELPWKQLITNALIVICTVGIAFSMNSILDYFHVARFIEELELKTYDLRTSIRLGEPKIKADPRTMIVKYDDLTLNLYENEYGTWPWPRKVQSEVIDYMDRAGARMIAYDMMFTAPQKGQEESDKSLVETFKSHPNVYFSMNFDNNLELYHQAGQDLSPKVVDEIKPLSIHLTNHLSRENRSLQIDNTPFYTNPAMTFNHFRPLMPELMTFGQRIAFINHGRDIDGISRGNPLFFRFMYNKPVKTTFLPIQEKTDPKDPKTKYYMDAKKRLVSKNGILLNLDNEPVTKLEASYYPYLAFRMMYDIVYPKQKLHFNLTPEGYLDFGKHHVPLSADGSYLVVWYNYNYDVEEAQKFLNEHAPRVQEMERLLEQDPKLRTATNLKEVKLAKARIRRAETTLHNDRLAPAPFPEISVSHILTAITHEKTGKLTRRDKALKAFLKDKVIFVGTTALATYDIKSTPINPMMPGVIIQAHIFDNLLQNKMYLRRLSPTWHLAIMVCLSMLAAFTTLKLKSANAGFLTSATLILVYVIITVVAFKEYGLWLNIVLPVTVIVITMTLSFMAKYISRDRDYKRTYILATTDSMTGLHNHRYFKEQMIQSIERSKRTGQKFSLVLIDIDFFKKFNDSYGHQAGDEVLRCVARKLKNSVRSVDVVARYGGEEMAVILDRSAEVEALEVAKKLVNAIASEAYPIAEGVAKHVTISVGVATYPTHSETVDGLIEFSDQGLYRAKENGRNQVGAQYDHDVPPKPEGAEKEEQQGH